MTLQQLRSIQEVVRNGLNISAAARALDNTPPNVSRYIRMLEEELSVRMFNRAGGRLVGLTPEGNRIMDMVVAVLDSADGLQRMAQVMQHAADGRFAVGSDDVCAVGALPPAVAAFRKIYPGVMVNILRGSTQEMIRLVSDGSVDCALIMGDMTRFDDLVALPYAQHELSIVMSRGHPLSQEENLTLPALADYPLATYISGHAGRASVDAAFAAANVLPDIVYESNDAELCASIVLDSDVIGIICGNSREKLPDGLMQVSGGSGLFAPVSAYICMRRESVMRRYGYEFVELLAPQLTCDKVMRAFYTRDSSPAAGLPEQPVLQTARHAADNIASLQRLRSGRLSNGKSNEFLSRSIATY